MRQKNFLDLYSNVSKKIFQSSCFAPPFPYWIPLLNPVKPLGFQGLQARPSAKDGRANLFNYFDFLFLVEPTFYYQRDLDFNESGHFGQTDSLLSAIKQATFTIISEPIESLFFNLKLLEYNLCPFFRSTVITQHDFHTTL